MMQNPKLPPSRLGADATKKEDAGPLSPEMVELRYRLAVRRGQAWNVGKQPAAIC